LCVRIVLFLHRVNPQKKSTFGLLHDCDYGKLPLLCFPDGWYVCQVRGLVTSSHCELRSRHQREADGVDAPVKETRCLDVVDGRTDSSDGQQLDTTTPTTTTTSQKPASVRQPEDIDGEKLPDSELQQTIHDHRLTRQAAQTDTNTRKAENGCHLTGA